MDPPKIFTTERYGGRSALRGVTVPGMQTWQEALARQEGVLARRQALKGGMSERQWDWRISSGRWQRLLPGVIVSHTGTPTDRELGWAGCLHAGDDAVLSGDAALRVRGFTGHLARELHVVVPPERRIEAATTTTGALLLVHRARVPERRCATVQGLPVADPHLSALHAAAWAPDDRGAEWRLAASVQQRLTAVPLLRTALAEMPRLRRRALIRVVLDDVQHGAHAGSELEFLRFCRRHGVPVPDELQVRVRAGGTKYVDARYRRQRVSVELDGAHHRDAEQWEADALRALELAVAMPGERLVRLTPGLLRHQPGKVAHLLRSLLA